jgi:hypothetical protein
MILLTAANIFVMSAWVRLEQAARNVAAACASLGATLREVLDERFWQ